MTLDERIMQALTDNGIGEAPSTIHSWRCEYPDRYGPCDCLTELVGDLAALFHEEREAFGQRIKEAVAAATDRRGQTDNDVWRIGYDEANRRALAAIDRVVEAGR